MAMVGVDAPLQNIVVGIVPVIAVCAVRTGCGKSQTTRWLSKLLQDKHLRIAVIRHPMPYGDLEKQAVQRFATRANLDAADCTIASIISTPGKTGNAGKWSARYSSARESALLVTIRLPGSI